MSRSRKPGADTDDGALDNAPVRIGGPSVAYVRWSDLRRSSAARRQVRAARALARRLRRAA
ncbi:MAG: hypothetical protein U5K43_04110 [Halofilum sp. (in: g-proteobacteria)]|nr:hypothetical protein [Halofilum sp. (in: g-proteobacteria)]